MPAHDISWVASGMMFLSTYVSSLTLLRCFWATCITGEAIRDQQPYMLSSEFEPMAIEGATILSNDPGENPAMAGFAKWNVHYCSQDLWLGDGDVHLDLVRSGSLHVKGVLDQSGYEGQKISFKTDQEVSILALKKAIAALRIGETVPIESPVRASKSNGKRRIMVT